MSLANDASYRAWVTLHNTVTAAVRCPRCKVQPGVPCDWGTGHTSSAEYTQAHQPRVTLARKVGALTA